MPTNQAILLGRICSIFAARILTVVCDDAYHAYAGNKTRTKTEAKRPVFLQQSTGKKDYLRQESADRYKKRV